MSQPQTLGTYCPGPVIFTCVGTGIIPSLFWRVNGSTVANYAFESSHTFPRSLNINPPLDDVTVEIVNASGLSTINVTSVLNVTDVLVLNGASLHCADVQIESDTLLIDVDTLRKFFYCTVMTKTDPCICS